MCRPSQVPLVFRLASENPTENKTKNDFPPKKLSSITKPHGRAILTDQLAREIFCNKPAPGTKERTRAGSLSKIYGVSVKTIRDIWIGRTWYRATCHLDLIHPPETERLQKKAGRPRGVKDRSPRARKNSCGCAEKSDNELTQNNLSAIENQEHSSTLAQQTEIGSSELELPLSPGEFQTELPQDTFADIWDSAPSEKGGGFCFEGPDYRGPAEFDPFEGMEISEPSCGFVEFF